MAKQVDDSDPRIGYIGSSWNGDQTKEGTRDSYSNSTFYSTTKNGDYCIIKWTGTDISVYGARRDNHVCHTPHLRGGRTDDQGIYGIVVDNGGIQYYSGFSSTNQFQQVLFATSGLAQGDHEIKVSNENARNLAEYPNYIWLDVDHVSVTGDLLNANPNAAGPTSQASAPAPSPSTTTTQQAASSAPPPPPSESSAAPSSTVTSSSAPPTSSAAPTSSASAITSSSAISTSSSSASASASASAIELGTIGQYTDPAPPASSAVITSGNPNVPANSDAADANGKDENKTTVVAVSVTIIVVAVVVICTIGGLWWWRRRRRQREEAEDDRNYLQPQPQSAWR